jgi:hypothetical protein
MISDNIYTISLYITRPTLVRLLQIYDIDAIYANMMRLRRMTGYLAVEFPKRYHFSNIYDFIIYQYNDGYVHHRDEFPLNINDEIYKYTYRFIYKYDRLYYCRRHISDKNNMSDILSEFSYYDNLCLFARISNDTGNYITVSIKVGEYIKIYNVWKIDDNRIYKYGNRISVLNNKSILLSEYNLRDFIFGSANNI